MQNLQNCTVTLELLKHVTDERIFRELATRVVQTMPFSELSKLIKFGKIDPTTEESRIKMNDPMTPKHEKAVLAHLLDRMSVFYTAEADLLDGFCDEEFILPQSAFPELPPPTQ